MIGRQTVGIVLLTLATSGAAVVASAQESGATPERQATSVVTVAAPASLANAFQRRAASAAAAPSEHLFGVGVRAGGYGFGIGGTVRYFLPTSPLGIQAEASRYGVGVAGLGYDYSSTLFDVEVLYRLNEIKIEAPLKLQPYAGGGVAIIRTSYDVLSNTSTGAIFTGGVEVFFDQVPKLGVSGAFEFTTNGAFNSVSIGGPAFIAAAHYYLK